MIPHASQCHHHEIGELGMWKSDVTEKYSRQRPQLEASRSTRQGGKDVRRVEQRNFCDSLRSPPKTGKIQRLIQEIGWNHPPFIQRFNLDTEHHRECTEKHVEMILSVHLREKLRETLCDYSLSIIRTQFHLKMVVNFD